MEGIIHFNFRDQKCSGSFIICQKGFPTYIYVTFTDESLIGEFGEEICIHTDGSNLITTNIYSDKRLELFTVILNDIRQQVPLAEIRLTEQMAKRI